MDEDPNGMSRDQLGPIERVNRAFLYYGVAKAQVQEYTIDPCLTMPFKSKAQRRKFAALLVEGKISDETYEEWNRETGKAELPERVGAAGGTKLKPKPKPKAKVKRKTRPPRKAK
jgi:hypothetical protein